MKKPGLSVAAQIGLLSSMNQQKERDKNREWIAFCNTARYVLDKREPSPVKLDVAEDLSGPVQMVEIPRDAFDSALHPSGGKVSPAVHVFGTDKVIRFMTETHRCPVETCNKVYVFWRSELQDDADTIPMCPHCASKAQGPHVAELLRQLGWKRTVEGWLGPADFGIADDLLEKRDMTESLFVLSSRLGLTSEAVLSFVLPPLPALSPLEPLTLLITQSEHHRLAQAEEEYGKGVMAKRWKGFAVREAGYGCFRKMAEMFPQTPVSHMVWRNLTCLRIPDGYAEKLMAGEETRLLLGKHCPASLARVEDSAARKCSCGALVQSVRCSLGLETAWLLEPHVPASGAHSEALPN